MKPPSYLLSQYFTFDEELFVGSDCMCRGCTRANIGPTACIKCICFTHYYNDKRYQRFANILVKEVP